MDIIQSATIRRMQTEFKIYLEDIMGLHAATEDKNSKLKDVMGLLLNLRKEAKAKKDFVTSDKIRDELSKAGILVNDEKDGSVSWSIA